MTDIKRVAVIDTGAGNLFSLFSCLKRIGFVPVMVSKASDIDMESEKQFKALIIPGQGRFGSVMQRLNENGLSKVIKDWYQQDRTIVGICVGLQIFFESSEEDLDVEGLSLLEGRVTKLNSPKQPMVGWCSLNSEVHYLSGRDVYFVNSYAVKNSKLATSLVSYGDEFAASINSKGLTAFQFHPEKSGKQGEEILKQCLN